MATTGWEISPSENPDSSVEDDLDLARVLKIFLRTWPFIKPLTRHLILFVVCSPWSFCSPPLVVSSSLA